MRGNTFIAHRRHPEVSFELGSAYGCLGAGAAGAGVVFVPAVFGTFGVFVDSNAGVNAFVSATPKAFELGLVVPILVFAGAVLGIDKFCMGPAWLSCSVNLVAVRLW